ncbi:MAG: hypothetical protein WDN69_02460 [Aliidongia sp.]
MSVSAPPPVDTARIVALNARQTDPYSVCSGRRPGDHPGGRAASTSSSASSISRTYRFLVIPDSPAGDGGLGGNVRMASLRAYDIELNLSQHWINLFSPDHCDGKGRLLERFLSRSADQDHRNRPDPGPGPPRRSVLFGP